MMRQKMGHAKPIFDGMYLHEIIRQELKETRLHETLTKVVVPTSDIELLVVRVDTV